MEIQHPHSITKRNISLYSHCGDKVDIIDTLLLPLPLRSGRMLVWKPGGPTQHRLRVNGIPTEYHPADKSHPGAWDGSPPAPCHLQRQQHTDARRAAPSTVESYKWQCQHLCRTGLSWPLLGWHCCRTVVDDGFHYFRLGPGNIGPVSSPSILPSFPNTMWCGTWEKSP